VSAPTAFYERSLDCVHCGLCLPACPTYDVLGLETDSPRGRIYLMRALAEGRVEDPNAIEPHLARCLDCRACESACPSGVRYGEILETARSEMQARWPQRGLRARLRRWLLRAVVARKPRLRLLFTVLRAAERLGLRRLATVLHLLPKLAGELMPPIPGRSARAPLSGTFTPPGTSRGRVALFTGCVMEQMFGDVNRKTLALLLANGFTVDVPEHQVCCGALLVHDGLADDARALARQNLAAFAPHDTVIHNAAGCGAAMRAYGHLLGEAGESLARRCRDVTEFLAERGLARAPAPHDGKVAYDDPCHLCHGQGVRAQPRALLAQVPGLQLVSHQDPEACCGSAGIYNLVHGELAAQIGRKKAAALLASGAATVATGNPGCMLQIQAHLREAGSDVRVVHPVELLLPSG
jgi:glycolate oxidase iron-sulfur subunit